jgi:PKD repeat protein
MASDRNLVATVTAQDNSGLGADPSAPTNITNIKDGDDSTLSISNAGVSHQARAPKRIWHSDLGAAYDIDYVVLRVTGNNFSWWTGLNAAVGADLDPGYLWARVEYSTDNTAWSVIGGTLSHTAGNPDVITLTPASPVNAQYWRAYVQGHIGSRYFGSATIFTMQIVGGLTSLADFVGTPRDGMTPLSVQFTDISEPGPDSWLWTFGDGSTSTAQNPLHTYSTPGLYDVTLEVNGTDSTTKIEYISVKSQPILPYYRDRLLLSVRASYTDERLYNHALVVATGNKAAIIYGEESDTDEDSPTRIEAIGDRLIKLETDLITTQQTADKAAKKLFLDNCLISEDVQLEALCNAALEGNDVVGVQETTFSQVESNFRLQSFTVPLSTSRQRLRLARVINLQTQTISVNDDIIFVDSTQAVNSTQDTSVVIDTPSVDDGDLLLFWMALDEDGADQVPTIGGTWNSISGTNKWKWRIAASEPANRTVTWGSNRRGIATMLAYRNVDPTSPVARLVVENSAEDKAVNVPGMTIDSGEYHLVSGVQADYGGVTYTWPASWTEREEAETGGSDTLHVSTSTADKPFVGANPKGFTVTASLAKGQTRYQIALRKDIS